MPAYLGTTTDLRPVPGSNEPGGITHAGGTLYVADTNNHAIRAVDVETGTVSAWPLRDIARLTPPAVETTEISEAVVRGGPVVIRGTR